MPRFKKGDIQLTFTRRDGRKFTKTFHSKSSSMRAERGWTARGGKRPRFGVFNPKRRRY
ncbi:hypothetical protein ACFSKN_02100 [Mariniflexile gromovii]|uniref:Uncharacterized protein n=1 Tax=Mariniflexile gromovii TaxID=362523 RepID=A0ABS4BP67_9FLAO|nr:hypothetical protein [Mariniflexile gromovii]MBP0902394.1 hypothetical protein [Mariniflexile gromovii]